MFYRIKLALLRNLRFNYVWRYWKAWRGHKIGNYEYLPQYIKTYTPDHSFVDVGCMWGVNGRYSFLAEEYGASSVKAVDVFGPTPEFTEEHDKRSSAVEFILGDIADPEVLKRIGKTDIVFCAGVLYHHPSPFDLLVALRRICGQRLILRTYAIPEIRGLPHAAVYFPYLSASERKMWDLSSLGLVCQPGISNPYDPAEGYGNFFWGMTPSCLRSMIRTAGFAIESSAPEAFAQTFICKPVAREFIHELPNPDSARAVGEAVSSAGIARPA